MIYPITLSNVKTKTLGLSINLGVGHGRNTSARKKPIFSYTNLYSFKDQFCGNSDSWLAHEMYNISYNYFLYNILLDFVCYVANKQLH